MIEVLTMGRAGVDVYPLQVGVSLREVETFGKYLGGSPTNVAVAAARLGRASAVITRTGDDPFGLFVRDALRAYGVDDRYVTPVAHLPTPVTFCEIMPPDDFPLYFYRLPKAPDLEILPEELDLEAVAGAKVFWATLTGLSQEPSRAAHFAAWRARGRAPHTVLDLDHRPMFWPRPDEARDLLREALRYVTVAVGNLDEVEVATGTRDPEAAAEALLEAGAELAVVKQGPAGVLGMTAAETVRVPPVEVEVVNGLGAGDAFGGALCHGLLEGWPLEGVLRFANAAGAIVAGRLACAPAMPRQEEVTDLLAGRAGGSSHGTHTFGTPPGASPGASPGTVTQASPGTVPAGDTAPGATAGTTPAAVAATRARHPGRIAEALAARGRRSLFRERDRLLIVAADHTARGMIGLRGRPAAMESRAELLERLCVALGRPGVDGVLGTPDVVEDLLLLGALEGKIVIGSMNRGGLHGSAFEFDDRFTAYDASSIAGARLDGGKMLCRIGVDDPATARTLEACGRAVTELAAHDLVAMVEPFWSRRVGGEVVHDLSPEGVIRSVHVAQALGATSARTWLKIPVVDDMERVMRATTLPTLLLGGDPGEAPEAVHAAWRRALRLPGVRGLVVGRALLYPADDDVAAAVDAAAEMLEEA